ncbi:MAG: PfkB family carbohydrate kinase [Planctomycetes bacterium]|jgi:ribokinase|nr:PfkB family carbohydrate kinase [Planctomycetota bacterium]
MGTGTRPVFGIGQCALDHLGRIEAWPEPDSKREFRDLTVQGGGPVATALVALARWGFPGSFAGVVGDDGLGSSIRASLEEEGVDASGLLVRPSAGSQFAFVAVEPDGRRTIFWRRPTGAPPRPDELDLDRIRSARVVHTDGMFPEASLAAAEAAREAGVPVSVDAGSMRPGMLELARTSEIFLASSTFARSFLGRDDPEEACRRLAELGPRVAGVTRGARGCVAIADGRRIEQAAYPVRAEDTTGCGDVFHAGFLYGFLSGWPAGESLDFAAWAASRVALRLGGRAGIPDAGEWPGRSRGAREGR